MVCTIIGRDMIYISQFINETDPKVIIFDPFPVFGGVRCACECHTGTQYPWGSKLPTEEASLRCIRIGVHWPFLEYCQHQRETCQVVHLNKEIIRRELTQGTLWTMSPNIHGWRAITRSDFTACRMGSTRAITVWIQLVHLDGYRWGRQLLIYLYTMYLVRHHLKILLTKKQLTTRSVIWHVLLIQQTWVPIGRQLEWNMQGGKYLAKELDCTTSIASTQNNGIHGIQFSQHTTFNRLNCLASNQKHESITIWGVDWTTSKSNHFNLQILCTSSPLNRFRARRG